MKNNEILKKNFLIYYFKILIFFFLLSNDLVSCKNISYTPVRFAADNDAAFWL